MEIKLLGLQDLLQAIRVVIFKIEKMKFYTEKWSHNATSKPPSTSNNSAMKQSQSRSVIVTNLLFLVSVDG